VKAVGNIEIYGVCEAATLISERNIVLGNGALGMDKGSLSAELDITAKFIEGCKVNAGGSITADSIRKSHVRCGGNVILSGKNGALIGGTMIVGNKLEAKTIGSPMGTNTEIQVGGNPKEFERHKAKVEDFNKMKAEFVKCDQAVNTLNAMKQKEMLTDDKKALLLKMINTKMVLRERMAKLQEELDELVRVLTTNTGTVSASKVIRSGVNVTIGNAKLIIREDIQNSKLWNNGAKVAIGPNI
jgi:hypothetical protein